MQSSVHHDIIYTILYFVENMILLGSAIPGDVVAATKRGGIAVQSLEARRSFRRISPKNS